MARPTSEELQTVADLRVAIRRFLAATNAVTEAHGLTPRQYDLLALLHAPSPPGNQAAIADSLCLSRSSTTELLTRAAEAGLVTRSLAEDDTRNKLITPTALGTRRFYGAVTELRGERSRLFGLLAAAAGIAASLAG